MRHYPIEKKYKEILITAGIPVDELLHNSGLPVGLFDEVNPVVTLEEYFHFMQAIERFHIEDELVLQLTTAQNIETFSPPAFAAYCSKNAMSCMKRMKEYEALFCGIDFKLSEEGDYVILDIDSIDRDLQMPRLFVIIKMSFILHLIRKATNILVSPVRMTSQYSLDTPLFQQYFGTNITLGETNRMVFTKHDMMLPFQSENESMWSYFEPELNRRKQELEVDESFCAEVRNCLVEILANGESSVALVAQRLGMSVRTLQRKLQGEGTNFQQQLNHTRELLAKNYLYDQQLGVDEIAFLLGYQDASSLQRAFTIWTGMSVSEYRKGITWPNK